MFKKSDENKITQRKLADFTVSGMHTESKPRNDYQHDKVLVSSEDGTRLPLTVSVAHRSDTDTATNGLGDEFVNFLLKKGVANCKSRV